MHSLCMHDFTMSSSVLLMEYRFGWSVAENVKYPLDSHNPDFKSKLFQKGKGVLWLFYYFNPNKPLILATFFFCIM